MEEILAKARKVAEDTDVFMISCLEIPVDFEGNRLKNIQSKQSNLMALRVVRNGKIGYASTTNLDDSAALVEMAIETSNFGIPAQFEFPVAVTYPEVNVSDSKVDSVSIERMVSLGEEMIAVARKDTPELVCEAGVTKETTSVKIKNSRGTEASYKKTGFSLGVGGTLIRDTDMLFVGESQCSCHPILDTKEVTGEVLCQLEMARNLAVAPTRQMPVIFTPNGVAGALIPALMTAFNGKTVLEGASPVGKRVGDKIFDSSFSLSDDPTLDYCPRSRLCDDEGIPSQCTPLITSGVVNGFFYDLQTAGIVGARSTGNASRGRGGLVSPFPSALVVTTGKTTFEEMVQDIKEGLIVDFLMGAEQGNILGGDFSGNVLLGYKIENGKITGRVKNTMVAGNVYQALSRIVATGKKARWVKGSVLTPHIYCAGLSVASK
jgi:PmbA protein